MVKNRDKVGIGLGALWLALGMSLILSACGSDSGSASNEASVVPASLQAASALVVRTVEVPSTLAAAPFDRERQLSVPAEFGVRLWARVTGARFMALAPNGDVLVSQPTLGKIILLRARPNAVPETFDFATGLHFPHDMVFHRIGDVTYLYVAESNQVTRSVYQAGDTRSASRETVVAQLPDNSTPELMGRYGHQLKNIALSPEHKLYVSIASTCNACLEDTVSDPVRGAIYEYSADGKERRLFARGLRNAEGLDILPGSNALWVTVNNRDEVRVPSDIDVDGDQRSDLGEIVARYVDDNPPEPFTVVRDGAHYGWPFCNSSPNAAMAELPLLPDFEFNLNSMRLNCASVARASKGVQAHAAPLGFSFLHTSNLPLPYRKGAALALHGCWNCTSLRAGYKVIYFPFDDAGNAGAERDLVAGFVIDPDARSVWGRPVDVIADGQGGLLVSDDYAGALYQLYPK